MHEFKIQKLLHAKGHKPLIVKKAVIGSKGGLVEAQHNIFKLLGVS